MAKYLYRLGLWSARNRVKVMLGGIGLLLAAAILALTIGPAFNENTPIPGLQSQEALETMNKEFPSPPKKSGETKIVFKAPDNERLSSQKAQTLIASTLKLVAEDPTVQETISPYQNGSLSADRKIAYATVTYRVPGGDVTPESKTHIESAIEKLRDAGWQAELTGDGYVKMKIVSLMEVVGVLIAFLVLSVTFASFLTGVLPIATAVVGLGIGLMGVLLGSNVLDMSSTSLSLSAMLGLAVGIDYALFIVSRYRQQLSEGYDREESIAIANGTAGSSVVFAGITVIIGLCGLAVAQIPFLTAMGLAGALCVLVAVIIAVIFVLAVLSAMGDRISAKPRNALLAKFSRKSSNPSSKRREGVDTTWGLFVTRRPWLAVLAGVILLAAIALPFSRMELGMPDDAQKPVEQTERRAYDLQTEAYGAGIHSPLVILAETSGGTQGTTEVQKAIDALGKFKNIGTVAPAMPGTSGHLFLISVIPSTGAHDQETRDLVQQIRDESATIQQETGVRLMVTGSTAVGIDISQKLNDALPKFCLVIIGLAFLLLMMVFRSLLVPIKAVLGFVLSLGATFGFVVLVVQDGHMGTLFGFGGPGPVLNFLPIIVVGILFGLAMDYEVFLVSRMREEFKRSGDAKCAVLAGIKHSGSVVTAAGLIMISVFVGFMLAEDPIIKSMGFALAFGILFDAFVVRMLIVPGAMTLMGRSAWYLPKWLDRILPNIDVKGESVMEEVERRKTEAA
ncbi:hypothetical protein B9G55_05510 [Saccharibacillus sp. O16]|nr:hypothetical protein B9G55_05510 [Saccharibacillus sp. O16]